VTHPQDYPCGRCDCDEQGTPSDGSTWTTEVGTFDRCPSRLVTRRSRFFWDLYQHYQRGVLPVAGGLLEQPYLYYHSMTIIERLMNQASAEKAQKKH
jgi:hypothetical protein